ncbi:MAG: hypothetical protein IIA14_05330 [SAR324 cluster bacterium]|nr:hypothetical protein [SAR324 cluster bacterium]
MVQFQEVTDVAYCRIAAVAVDPPPVQAAFRAGLDARFPFLSDTGLRLTDELGIRETTDKRHGPLPVPFTFALLPGLRIHRIFNGWYMVGRPTPEELRQTIREMTAIIRKDIDFQGE